MSVRYSWTQPCCTACWNERNPDRQAVALIEGVREAEVCVHCGGPTRSGIYVRIDPNEADYPTMVKS